jgi:hypothetical protein
MLAALPGEFEKNVKDGSTLVEIQLEREAQNERKVRPLQILQQWRVLALPTEGFRTGPTRKSGTGAVCSQGGSEPLLR